jgi:hypothetical protein
VTETPGLAADAFDNGRSAHALRRSFAQSQHVAIARDGNRVVATARLLYRRGQAYPRLRQVHPLADNCAHPLRPVRIPRAGRG